VHPASERNEGDFAMSVAARIIRPLNQLASTASRFGGDRIEPVAVRGPRDVRTGDFVLQRHGRRVSDLLREKDHMISRSRRAPASLSRSLAALAESVVEEFCELGKNASFADAPRTPLAMQPAAVKRLVRNLIENAIKSGGRAKVSIERAPGTVALCVDDDGPGIPETMLSQVKEPFVRLEEPGSRQTGGIGLGLAIANAIAHSWNAELDHANRAQGGLRARVRWKLWSSPRPGLAS
jgi:signal transduction histidine kinase